MSLSGTLRFILTHPLARRHRAAALARYLRWQVKSRVRPGPFAVPYVGGTRLWIRRGLTGATGNLYAGLHEFPEMALALHLLNAGDLFVDVGANVGAWTVLASGARGAHSVAFEADAANVAWLERNVAMNGLEGLVTVRQCAVGANTGRMLFSGGRDTTSRASVAGEAGEGVEVTTLDEALSGGQPTMIKIDVEGFECPVLDGASRILAMPALLAVVVEMNGSGTRYGFSDTDVHERLCAAGLRPARYDAFARRLEPTTAPLNGIGNAIYARAWDRIVSRIGSAPRCRIAGVDL